MKLGAFHGLKPTQSVFMSLPKEKLNKNVFLEVAMEENNFFFFFGLYRQCGVLGRNDALLRASAFW